MYAGCLCVCVCDCVCVFVFVCLCVSVCHLHKPTTDHSHQTSASSQKFATFVAHQNVGQRGNHHDLDNRADGWSRPKGDLASSVVGMSRWLGVHSLVELSLSHILGRAAIKAAHLNQ